MGRLNKKESIVSLHRENILSAAEKLFLEKGAALTTIEDISKASEYSRRTIYVYYESKEDILYHVILKGLIILKEDLVKILNQQTGFVEQYMDICKAMDKYQSSNPQSAISVNQMSNCNSGIKSPTLVINKILELGTEINSLLADFIEQGKSQGVVRTNTEAAKTVYIMWSSITSLLTLVQNKGEFLEQELSTSRASFLEYGYKQIINSILVERI